MIDTAELPEGVDRLPFREPMPKERFDPLAKEIFTLKKQLNAVILAHNYQVTEIQEAAGYAGDSHPISARAARPCPGTIDLHGAWSIAKAAAI